MNTEVVDEPVVVLIPTGTMTPTATSVPTRTATASPTPILPTATQTLAPSITMTSPPDFTPTSTTPPDFGPMHWATQEVPGICPEQQNTGPLQLTNPRWDYDQSVLELKEYLNAGGTFLRSQVLDHGVRVDFVDVTNDGVPDVVVNNPVVIVFSCFDGEYVELFRLFPGETAFDPVGVEIRDLNRNGVRDLVVSTQGWGAHNYTLKVTVYEWNGQDFVNNIAVEVNHPYKDIGGLYGASGEIWMFNGWLELEDVDKNGTVELLLHGGTEGGYSVQTSAPQLSETHTWMWNGSEYTFVDVTFSDPWIKYHAIVTADLYGRMGQYERALGLYHRAIYDEGLVAWNREWNAPPMGGGFEVYPTRAPEDYQQGERIKAYARFKVMLTRYLSGDISGAELQFNTNQAIYKQGYAGYPYAHLSKVFHDAYIESQSIASGCAAVRGYAEQHVEEVLWPLGNGVYGEANRSYQPFDLCPF